MAGISRTGRFHPPVGGVLLLLGTYGVELAAQHRCPGRVAAFGRHAADLRGAGQEEVGCADAACLLKSPPCRLPPKQTEVTGPQGGPIQLTLREMIDEQLLALIAQETAKQQALPVESAPLPPPTSMRLPACPEPVPAARAALG